MEAHTYTKVLLLKPVVSMDNAHQIGFLPGSMNEKLAPWMASYMDNIDFIMNIAPTEEAAAPKNAPLKNKTKMAKVMAAMERDREKDKSEKEAGRVSIATELMEHGFIEIGSMEHIRGRSLPNQYIIIDEAQNLSVNSIKTLITRAGEGTKIVLLGDIDQIDSPYLDASSNGLTYVADKFKGQTLAAHIQLTKSERSKLAEIAANIL
jgi:PhoH-like ATPase